MKLIKNIIFMLFSCSIILAHNAELRFTIINATSGKFNLTVTKNTNRYGWDYINDKVVIIDTYTKEFTNVGSVSFDSPDSKFTASQYVPWAVLSIELQSLTESGE